MLDVARLHQAAEHTLVHQGFVRDGDVWRGKHNYARVTNRLGQTAGETSRLLGLPAPSDPDRVNTMVIEYQARK